jgi:hypothetical protein
MSTATTGGLSKGGGRSPAPTDPLIKCSGMSWNLQRRAIGQYTRDTSRAPTAQPTVHQEGFSPLMSSASTSSTSPTNSDPSSSASGTLVQRAALKQLVPALRPEQESSNDLQSGPRQLKPLEARPRQLPIPQTGRPSHNPPAPYQRNLTPIPSLLLPHCLARDHLRQWIPARSQTADPGVSGATESEHEQVKDTMIHVQEEDTREAYGTGLLMWHCFCDSRATPEHEKPGQPGPVIGLCRSPSYRILEQNDLRLSSQGPSLTHAEQRPVVTRKARDGHHAAHG